MSENRKIKTMEPTQKQTNLYNFLACLLNVSSTAELIINKEDGEKYLARLENDMARLNAAYESVKEVLENDKIHTN